MIVAVGQRKCVGVNVERTRKAGSGWIPVAGPDVPDSTPPLHLELVGQAEIVDRLAELDNVR
ncbi:MAG: hypothetical protein U5K28_04455 [Halobacteriales archaeon]|nr:hypothetical protein [Halobacteriales archaeon]